MTAKERKEALREIAAIKTAMTWSREGEVNRIYSLWNVNPTCAAYAAFEVIERFVRGGITDTQFYAQMQARSQPHRESIGGLRWRTRNSG